MPPKKKIETVAAEAQVKKSPKKKALEILIKYHDKDLGKIEKIPVGDWIDLRSAEIPASCKNATRSSVLTILFSSEFFIK